jgi:two-component system, NtrC family, sensor histidine kinase HydH
MTNPRTTRFLLPVAIAALPIVLLYSSLRTFHELDEQRAVYLRQRVALLAGRLERLPPAASERELFEMLSEEDSQLEGVRVIERGSDAEAVALEPLWDGRELFRTQSTGAVFRAYVPYHAGGRLNIARLDLNSHAADFLVEHAVHNIIAASAGGLLLVLLSIYSVWTMRRTARLQARQAEMEHLAHIGTMAAVLAHEIRNPLGTIKGFVQLAGERGDGGVRDLLEPALAETARLESLVNGLLAYGRPPSPSLRSATWDEVAVPLAAHARRLAGERALRVTISDAKIVWPTDPQLLLQALLNLVANAIEAATHEVRVGIEQAEGVRITVTDDGRGLTPDVQARLFEPFFTTKALGTGLGLATTRKLVRALGGELELASTSGGVTATILFSR